MNQCLVLLLNGYVSLNYHYWYISGSHGFPTRRHLRLITGYITSTKEMMLLTLYPKQQSKRLFLKRHPSSYSYQSVLTSLLTKNVVRALYKPLIPISLFFHSITQSSSLIQLYLPHQQVPPLCDVLLPQ
jgi:hypothetical protein